MEAIRKHSLVVSLSPSQDTLLCKQSIKTASRKGVGSPCAGLERAYHPQASSDDENLLSLMPLLLKRQTQFCSPTKSVFYTTN